MRRILSVSSSRSDVGILTPVWQAMAGEKEIDLHILLTGMHRAEGGEPVELPGDITVHHGGSDMGGGDDPVPAAMALADITADAAKIIAEIKPDLLLAIGDRLDMIPAVIASLPFNIPVVHLSGGDLTLGAIDDRIRHSITKLSHVHCVISTEAARRVHQMGEEAWRIHVTGATGLDALFAVPVMTESEFCTELGLENVNNLRIVTVHPETNGESYDAPLKAILSALEADPGTTLFSAPNADPGGAQMRVEIEAFVSRHPWAVFRKTLGTRLYANAMRLASVMVGNSSSGIIEAAAFGLNVINVGDRQESRASGSNVHHCPNDSASVLKLLSQMNSRATGNPASSLYGDGRAAPRVVQAVMGLPNRRQLLHKSFSDFEVSFTAPWETADGDSADNRSVQPSDEMVR